MATHLKVKLALMLNNTSYLYNNAITMECTTMTVTIPGLMVMITATLLTQFVFFIQPCCVVPVISLPVAVAHSLVTLDFFNR